MHFKQQTAFKSQKIVLLDRLQSPEVREFLYQNWNVLEESYHADQNDIEINHASIFASNRIVQTLTLSGFLGTFLYPDFDISNLAKAVTH